MSSMTGSAPYSVPISSRTFCFLWLICLQRTKKIVVNAPSKLLYQEILTKLILTKYKHIHLVAMANTRQNRQQVSKFRTITPDPKEAKEIGFCFFCSHRNFQQRADMYVLIRENEDTGRSHLLKGSLSGQYSPSPKGEEPRDQMISAPKIQYALCPIFLSGECSSQL